MMDATVHVRPQPIASAMGSTNADAAAANRYRIPDCQSGKDAYSQLFTAMTSADRLCIASTALPSAETLCLDLLCVQWGECNHQTNTLNHHAYDRRRETARAVLQQPTIRD